MCPFPWRRLFFESSSPVGRVPSVLGTLALVGEDAAGGRRGVDSLVPERGKETALQVAPSPLSHTGQRLTSALSGSGLNRGGRFGDGALSGALAG